MAGENDPKDPPAPPGNPPPQDPPKAQDPPAPPKEDKAGSDEPTARLLEAERKRNEAMRAELDQLKQKQKERADADAEIERKRLEEQGKFKELADNERIRADEARRAADDARKEADEIIVDSEIRIALIREGANDADIASLVPREGLTVSGGRVRGVEDVIRKFKEEKPHFFGEPRPGATSSRRTSPPPEDDSTKLGIKDVRKLTKEDYAKHKQDTLSKIRRREALGG